MRGQSPRNCYGRRRRRGNASDTRCRPIRCRTRPRANSSALCNLGRIRVRVRPPRSFLALCNPKVYRADTPTRRRARVWKRSRNGPRRKSRVVPARQFLASRQARPKASFRLGTVPFGGEPVQLGQARAPSPSWPGRVLAPRCRGRFRSANRHPSFVKYGVMSWVCQGVGANP